MNVDIQLEFLKCWAQTCAAVIDEYLGARESHGEKYAWEYLQQETQKAIDKMPKGAVQQTPENVALEAIIVSYHYVRLMIMFGVFE